MRRPVLLALAALALAPVPAGAQPYRDPYPYRDRPVERHPDRDRYRDDRDYDRYDGRYDRWRDRAMRRWTPIARAYPATGERQVIDLRGSGRRFSRLLVQGVRGEPVIERITVQFVRGPARVFDIDRQLWRGASEVIDLGGRRRIERIAVYTNPYYRGAYSIYAR